MLLELVLVAVVLSLVGVAVYQANNKTPNSSVVSRPAAPNSAAGIAASAAATTEKESTTDVSLSAAAETSADELSASDADVSNLGGTADASF
ncbi:MAG: hypothetical protein JWN01_650 [Patescibacteria group bacterium]|nr:hypothetical protein [Patescibacteria group bacterium]